MITNYSVSGMTCGHCVKAITSEVSELEGVDNVVVTLDNGGRMAITSDSPLDFEAVKAAVDEAGDYELAQL